MPGFLPDHGCRNLPDLAISRIFGIVRAGLLNGGQMNRSGGAVLAAVFILAQGIASPSPAEGLVLGKNTPNSSRLAVFRKQLNVLDSRAATQYSASALVAKAAGLGPVSIPNYSGRYRGLYLGNAKEAARRHGVPEELFLRLVQQESGWNPNAVSSKGATGLAQLMPETARRLGVNAADPVDNLDGGARYLRMMYDRFGDWRLALAAYNAGPEAVEKHGGVPPFAETKGYVRAILGI
jgi:soluble lytic murein transglycosylase-like protein